MTLDRIKEALSKGGYVIVAEKKQVIKEGERVTIWVAPEEPIFSFKDFADNVEKVFSGMPESTSMVYTIGDGIISTNAIERKGPNVTDPVEKICVQVHMNKEEAEASAKISK
jgi:hypothetical protein